MRVAVLIIGLLVGLLLFIQSWAAGALGEFADASGATETAGGAGLLMALCWLLACALVIPFPLASTIIFAVTVPIGLFTPTGDFGDLRFHGAVAVALTIMAFFGWRGKKQADEEKLEERERQRGRDERLEALLVQRHAAPSKLVSSTIPCPSCGHISGPRARFCEDCGTRIMRTLESSSGSRPSVFREISPAPRTANDWFNSMKNRS